MENDRNYLFQGPNVAERKKHTQGTDKLNDVNEVTQPFGDVQTRPHPTRLPILGVGSGRSTQQLPRPQPHQVTNFHLTGICPP